MIHILFCKSKVIWSVRMKKRQKGVGRARWSRTHNRGFAPEVSCPPHLAPRLLVLFEHASKSDCWRALLFLNALRLLRNINAGPPGFEPGIEVLETSVIPFHHGPIISRTCVELRGPASRLGGSVGRDPYSTIERRAFNVRIISSLYPSILKRSLRKRS